MTTHWDGQLVPHKQKEKVSTRSNFARDTNSNQKSSEDSDRGIWVQFTLVSRRSKQQCQSLWEGSVLACSAREAQIGSQAAEKKFWIVLELERRSDSWEECYKYLVGRSHAIAKGLEDLLGKPLTETVHPNVHDAGIGLQPGKDGFIGFR